MRISKEPEVRKREIMDAAMKLFAQKGYEATSMTDIAKEVKVVSGLCYRYFKNKEQLYYEALDMYAMECSAPMIKCFDKEHNSLEEFLEELIKVFKVFDGKERYHDFFHREGSLLFHKQLEGKMIQIVEPHLIKKMQTMRANGLVEVENLEALSMFILSGNMRIINDESLSFEEKIRIFKNIVKKLLM